MAARGPEPEFVGIRISAEYQAKIDSGEVPPLPPVVPLPEPIAELVAAIEEPEEEEKVGETKEEDGGGNITVNTTKVIEVTSTVVQNSTNTASNSDPAVAITNKGDNKWGSKR